jgi:hypothetical protein
MMRFLDEYSIELKITSDKKSKVRAPEDYYVVPTTP